MKKSNRSTTHIGKTNAFRKKVGHVFHKEQAYGKVINKKQGTRANVCLLHHERDLSPIRN